MKAGSAKGAQFHLLVDISHSFFYHRFCVEKPTELLTGRTGGILCFSNSHHVAFLFLDEI